MPLDQKSSSSKDKGNDHWFFVLPSAIINYLIFLGVAWFLSLIIRSGILPGLVSIQAGMGDAGLVTQLLFIALSLVVTFIACCMAPYFFIRMGAIAAPEGSRLFAAKGLAFLFSLVVVGGVASGVFQASQAPYWACLLGIGLNLATCAFFLLNSGLQESDFSGDSMPASKAQESEPDFDPGPF